MVMPALESVRLGKTLSLIHILDKTADNRCFVSLSGQRSYLESRGTDTSEMKDTDILKANTGSQVFLEAKLTCCDAMDDLALVISM